MFIDASAIVAILNREAGSDEIARRIAHHRGGRLVSPLVKFEAVAALARSRSGSTRPTHKSFAAAGQIVDRFCDGIEAREVAITAEIGQKALAAARTYGKFVGHKADLNFGDCFAYACAAIHNVRLVYKGDDFAKTDLA